MCKWGTHVQCRVWVCAEDSHTGVGRWAVKPIDACIAPLVNMLNQYGLFTRASCCGHGKKPLIICLQDGTELRGCGEIERRTTVPEMTRHEVITALQSAVEWMKEDGCDCGTDEPGTCALCLCQNALSSLLAEEIEALTRKPVFEEPFVPSLVNVPADMDVIYGGIANPSGAISLWLHQRAMEYHVRTEVYDRSVCSGPVSDDGGIMPATAEERMLINRNAQKIFSELGAQALSMGFTFAQWKAEVQKTARFLPRELQRDSYLRSSDEEMKERIRKDKCVELVKEMADVARDEDTVYHNAGHHYLTIAASLFPDERSLTK